MKKLGIIMFLGLAIIFTACNSTKVTSSWKAPSGPTHFNKIIVDAILPLAQQNLKPVIESELVKSLQSKGITAVSAYQTLGPTAFNNNEKQALKMLKKNGGDAVLTVVLLNKDKEQNYTPGTVGYQPYGIYYGGFRGYYHTLWDRVYTPGYYTTTSNYFWESNLYDLNSGKLMYSVQSETFDPSSAQNLATGYSKKVVDDMEKQGLTNK